MDKVKKFAMRTHVSDLFSNYDNLRDDCNNYLMLRQYYKDRMKAFGTEYDDIATYDYYRSEFFYYKYRLSLIESDLRFAKRRYLNANDKFSRLCNKK